MSVKNVQQVQIYDFGVVFDKKMMLALDSFGDCEHEEVKEETRELARDGLNRINRSLGLDQ